MGKIQTEGRGKQRGCKGKAKGERRLGEKANKRQRKTTAKQWGSKGKAEGEGQPRDPEVT